MKTAFDNDDWETQLRTMMGDHDAEEMVRTFNRIIAEHDANEGEPFTVLAIPLSMEEVSAWLEACHMGCLVTPSTESLYDVLWFSGLGLSHIYVDSDDMPPDEVSSAAASFFLQSLDDSESQEDDE